MVGAACRIRLLLENPAGLGPAVDQWTRSRATTSSLLTASDGIAIATARSDAQRALGVVRIGGLAESAVA